MDRSTNEETHVSKKESFKTTQPFKIDAYDTLKD